MTSLKTIKNTKLCFNFMRCYTSESSAAKIGFVGLGNMGGHMVTNLLKKHPVVVYDVNQEALDKAKQLGATICSNASEVAAQVTTLITMLPSSPHAKEVYLGNKGVLKSLNKDSLLIDCSTIDPDVSRALEEQMAALGSSFMDAPVSGGVTGARDATLTFMVGGAETSFKATRAVLSHMGTNVVYCGGSGTGQATKICNNMMLGITMIGTAEAMLLGQKLGLDAKLFASIVNTSSGQSWTSLKYNPCPGVVPGIPASNNYEGGFGSALMAKDLGLAQNSATSTATATPLGAMALQIYKMASANGFSNKDFASVFLFLQGLANQKK